jgi:hypothetical protein
MSNILLLSGATKKTSAKSQDNRVNKFGLVTKRRQP